MSEGRVMTGGEHFQACKAEALAMLQRVADNAPEAPSEALAQLFDDTIATMEQLDALARSWPRADLLIANPPYGKEAARFVQKAIDWMGHQQARVAVLLYLSFLEPAGDRASLFRNYPPDVLILSRRPKFDGKGTNSTASAWFVWPGRGQLVWLPP